MSEQNVAEVVEQPQEQNAQSGKGRIIFSLDEFGVHYLEALKNKETIEGLMNRLAGARNIELTSEEDKKHMMDYTNGKIMQLRKYFRDNGNVNIASLERRERTSTGSISSSERKEKLSNLLGQLEAMGKVQEIKPEETQESQTEVQS